MEWKKKKEKTRLLANCNYFWTLLLLLTRYNTIETIYDFHRNSSSKVAGRNKNTFDFVTELSSHLVWSLSTYFTYGWIARPSRRASKYVSRGVVEKKKKRERKEKGGKNKCEPPMEQDFQQRRIIVYIVYIYERSIRNSNVPSYNKTSINI